MSHPTPNGGTPRVTGAGLDDVQDVEAPVGDLDPEDLESGAAEPRDLDIEAPPADAAEQRLPVGEDRDEPLEGAGPVEADPGDVHEQHRVVALDEDDYR